MALSAQFTDVSTLVDHFISNEMPFFAVCDSYGNVLKKNEQEENIEDAASILSNYIKSIDKSNQQIFVVKMFETVPKGGIKKKSEADSQSNFKNPRQQYELGAAPATPYYQTNRELIDELRALREEVQAMRLRREIEDAEDDEEIAEQAAPQNTIGAILGNPAVQSVLVNWLTNITANLATPSVASTLRPTAMAGIPSELEPIIERLFEKGVTVDHLKKLSEFPTAKIKMLLTML